MEDIRFKTNRRAITRINNVHRKGQYQLFNFTNLGYDLFALKSGNSRQNEHNTDMHILNERHVTSVDGEDFDSFFHE